MSFRSVQAALLLAGLGLVSSTAARADILMDFSGDGPPHPQRVLIKDGWVKLTQPDQRQWDAFMLYDDSKDNLLQINPRSFRVYRFTRKRIAETRKAADIIRERNAEQLRLQLGGASPEERAQLERQLKGLDGPRFGYIEYSPTDRTREIAGVTCTVYEGVDSESEDKPRPKVAEACIASRDEIGISDEEFKTLRDMYRFSYYLAKTFFSPNTPFGPASGRLFDDDMDGVTIAVRLGDGPETKLTRVAHDDIPDGTMDIPKGFVEEDPFAPDPRQNVR